MKRTKEEEEWKSKFLKIFQDRRNLIPNKLAVILTSTENWFALF